MATLFRGIYEHQIDDKGRMRIPAKLKRGLGDSYSFVRGINNCIYVFPDDVLDAKLDEIDETLGEGSRASLLLFSSIFGAEEDPQGRVCIPAKLRAYSGITKDIVTIGRRDHIEIWSAENYNRFIENANYDEEFKTLGI